ncbi:hypothetical protein [Arenimonas terrae]|uniref:hypothetical protein n=1 Tax=Arenimonas terrae TaxID=2546226 RepID=UPI00159EC6FC|nr:hypothetical protein [Arenimonas terrae]
MRERAARIGATLEVLSPEGGGTRVAVQLPASLAYCDERFPSLLADFWRRWKG